jgi:hypothetical protein
VKVVVLDTAFDFKQAAKYMEDGHSVNETLSFVHGHMWAETHRPDVFWNSYFNTDVSKS